MGIHKGRYATALFVMLATPAIAQAPAAPMPVMATPAPATANASPSTQAYKQADEKMMAAMTHPMAGDADRDFVAGMLPHHIGAVDMAKVELQYGKDPVLRRLARSIIAAQDKEIALMRAWQRRHPTTP